MFEFMQQNQHIVLIAIGAGLAGLTGGLAIAVALAFSDHKPARKHRPRKLKSPRRHKKETEQRAKARALMQVASSAIH